MSDNNLRFGAAKNIDFRLAPSISLCSGHPLSSANLCGADEITVANCVCVLNGHTCAHAVDDHAVRNTHVFYCMRGHGKPADDTNECRICDRATYGCYSVHVCVHCVFVCVWLCTCTRIIIRISSLARVGCRARTTEIAILATAAV